MFVTTDVLNKGGQPACCFFFLCTERQSSTFLCALAIPRCGSHSVGFGDANENMRKGNVAGATSGASSGPPTSPPLLCCCCCAPVVVLRLSCVSLLCTPKLCSFTLELAAVHASSYKIWNLQFYCCVVPPVVVTHFKKTRAMGFKLYQGYSSNKTERQVPPPSPLLLNMLLLQPNCLCCAMLL